MQQLQPRGGRKSRPGGRQCRGGSLAGRCASTRNTPAYVRIRQHTSAYARRAWIRSTPHTPTASSISAGSDACIRQHTSAYVSARQNTRAHVRRAYHIRERHGAYLAAERLIHEGRRIRNHQTYCLAAWPSSAVGRRLRRGRASIRQIRPEKEACRAYKV